MCVRRVPEDAVRCVPSHLTQPGYRATLLPPTQSSHRHTGDGTRGRLTLGCNDAGAHCYALSATDTAAGKQTAGSALQTCHVAHSLSVCLPALWVTLPQPAVRTWRAKGLKGNGL